MISKPMAIIVILLFLVTLPAFGETLKVPEHAPWWTHLGATSLLFLHIVGGVIGILTGWVAIASKKGRRLHRLSGQTFFVAMFVSYLIAASVAPFLDSGTRPNTIAGILALYLLLSGVSAAQRRPFKASHKERFGILVAFFVTFMGVWFAIEGLINATGSVDGTPPQAFLIFIITGSFALYGELRVLKHGQLSNVERIKRHLWRMGASFFIASASFFMGQPQVFPARFNETLLPDILSFAPIIFMIYFLMRYSRTSQRTKNAS